MIGRDDRAGHDVISAPLPGVLTSLGPSRGISKRALAIPETQL
jgi:hypothetical protein